MSKIIELIFDLSHLLFEVPFSPTEHFFPCHNNFAVLSVFFFFFPILHIVCHRTQASYRLWIDMGITWEEVQHWNCKNTWTAPWDWAAFQTASAAQKRAEMEVKWYNNFGHTHTQKKEITAKEVGWQQKIRTCFWGAYETPREVRNESECVMKVTDK